MRINTRFFSVLLAIAATWSAVAAIRPLPEKRAVSRGAGSAALVVNEKTGPATAGRDFMSLFPTGRKAASPFLTIRNGQQLMPAVSAAPMAREAAEVPVIRGLVTYSDVAGFKRGVYTIPTSAGEPFDPIVTGMPRTRGATMTPEFFAGFTMLDNDFPIKSYYYTYNLETGEKLAEVDMSDVYTNVANDLTYDYTTGSSYGLSWSDDGRAVVLAKYDFTPTSYTRTQIAPLTVPAQMIAADRNGQLWIVGDGDLYKIDKTDGTPTRIGSTGHVSEYLSSMAFDQKSDRLFMTVSTVSSGYICEVNTTTGEATPIHIFEGGEELQRPSCPDIARP